MSHKFVSSTAPPLAWGGAPPVRERGVEQYRQTVEITASYWKFQACQNAIQQGN